MDDSNQLPNDLNQCTACWPSAALQVAELTDVLDATTESFEKLKQEHAAKLEELAWYKQWVHGRRSERLVEAEGQRHLFELIASDTQDATSSESPRQEIAGHTRRRRRHLDLSHLPHHRHETDLTAEEKICDGCGREKNRIGQDITTVLEHCHRSSKFTNMFVPSTLADIAKTVLPVRHHQSDRLHEASPVLG